MKYYYERYKGHFVIWKNNFIGVVCGYADNKIIFAMNDGIMKGITIDDSWFIDNTYATGYMRSYPKFIIGMSITDQLLLKNYKDFYCGNTVEVNNRIGNIEWIDYNIFSCLIEMINGDFIKVSTYQLNPVKLDVPRENIHYIHELENIESIEDGRILITRKEFLKYT